MADRSSSFIPFGCTGIRNTLCPPNLYFENENKANENLAKRIEIALKESAESPQESGGMLPQFTSLWEENNDLAGWLCVPDTKIDYPVMFTPNEPEYYLRKAFDGSYAISGSLFIGEGCSPEGNHVIIYGHQMNDGTMLGTLPKYAKKEYADEHPIIRFDTLYETREYEVLSAFYSRVYNDQDGEDVFRYYRYTDLSERKTFEEYVSLAKVESLYDTGVDAEYGDKIITLSTCSNHTEDGRFVVIARYKQEVNENSK